MNETGSADTCVCVCVCVCMRVWIFVYELQSPNVFAVLLMTLTCVAVGRIKFKRFYIRRMSNSQK